MAKKEKRELTFNGRRFIHEKQGNVPDGVAGRYRASRRGVLLMDLAGEPFGFVCSNDDYGRAGRGPGFLVSAYNTERGIWYMHGATEDCKNRLGITEETRYSHKQEMCASILRQAAA